MNRGAAGANNLQAMTAARKLPSGFSPNQVAQGQSQQFVADQAKKQQLLDALLSAGMATSQAAAAPPQLVNIGGGLMIPMQRGAAPALSAGLGAGAQSILQGRQRDRAEKREDDRFEQAFGQQKELQSDRLTAQEKSERRRLHSEYIRHKDRIFADKAALDKKLTAASTESGLDRTAATQRALAGHGFRLTETKERVKAQADAALKKSKAKSWAKGEASKLVIEWGITNAINGEFVTMPDSYVNSIAARIEFGEKTEDILASLPDLKALSGKSDTPELDPRKAGARGANPPKAPQFD